MQTAILAGNVLLRRLAKNYKATNEQLLRVIYDRTKKVEKVRRESIKNSLETEEGKTLLEAIWEAEGWIT